MSFYFKNIKPELHSDEDDEDELTHAIRRNETSSDEGSDSEDELRTISFGSLKKADDMMESEEKSKRKSKSKSRAKTATAGITKKNDALEKHRKKQAEEDMKREEHRQKLKEQQEREEEQKSAEIKMFTEESFDEDSESDSEGGFFEGDSADEHGDNRQSNNNSKKKKGKGKHAPSEASSKKKVRTIRKIPGLEENKSKSIYQDIRFDKALGRPEDISKVRQRYRFLDEYRQKEINELETMLRDKKFLSKISEREKTEMEQQVRQMKSRLETVQVMEMEQKIVKDYEAEINKNNKNKFHLKESEKRKVIQKWKFEHMKGKQREKVMERKRKKRLGKEFKQFEFHKR